jgi:tripartite-type tricarboxylate transporter receptor subunit TctC
MEKAEQYCHTKISTTAKGLAQFEVSSSYETPEASTKALEEALVEVREIIKRQGLKEAN